MKLKTVVILMEVLVFSSAAKAQGRAITHEVVDPEHSARQCLYLYPYNLHLTEGATSSVPLEIRTRSAREVDGQPRFWSFSESLVSITAEGFVTALRAEQDYEIGGWVGAYLQGRSVANYSIVRVLSKEYDVRSIELSRKNISLYFPRSLPNAPVPDLKIWVKKHQMLKVLNFTYDAQARLMGLRPFEGCRQIFEVDLGNTEENRVCGIAGNPIRLGWNIEGGAWQNCFMVPFLEPLSPQWFVILHEMGHSFTLASDVFWRGLEGAFEPNYVENLASAIGVATMKEALETLKLKDVARAGLQQQHSSSRHRFQNALDSWIRQGARFKEIDADVVDGIWLELMDAKGPAFVSRFFSLLDPRNEDEFDQILRAVAAQGKKGKHTFFAALVSAAAEEKLFKLFKKTYHFPLDRGLFNEAFRKSQQILTTAPLDDRFKGTVTPAIVRDWDGCSLGQVNTAGSEKDH